MAREKQKPLKNKKLGLIPSKTPKIAQVIPKKKLNYTKLFEKHYPKRAEPVKKAWMEFAKRHKLNERNFLRMIPVAENILKNTRGGATQSAFFTLTFLLENKNFKLSYFPLLQKITEKTEGYATDSSLSILNSILGNPNFKPEHLETSLKQFESLFFKIVENTKDSGSGFVYLVSLLKNTNFKPSYFPLLQKIVEKTKGEEIEFSLKSLDSLLKNKDFKPEHLKQFESLVDHIIRNTKTKRFQILNSLVRLSFILKNTNFKPSYFPLLQKIAENTKDYSTIYSLGALNTLLKNTNFKPEHLNSLLNNEPLFFTVLFSTYPAS
ncbi:hypothetical protein KAW38_04800, partial [Candidatus Micrarchaeota archaeon]|nr:hypothetical protein [Candidatus Micrarchaeota archaeon]